MDRELIKLAEPAVEKGEKVEHSLNIKNINRTVGAMLSGRISKTKGREGLPQDSIVFNFTGYAGQSFGGFLVNGVTLNLIGQANDYVGKGMSGGRITVRKHDSSDFNSQENIMAGNTLLYGATGGQVFISGVVGERFAVRNSGCEAVVEGTGDHACEYMTGGRVVILGKTGINFGAGMSGGIAYVLDDDDTFKSKVNMDMVNFEDLSSEEEEYLKDLIGQHSKYTKSKIAEKVVADWTTYKVKFVKVMPVEYKRVLEERAAVERAKGA